MITSFATEQSTFFLREGQLMIASPERWHPDSRKLTSDAQSHMVRCNSWDMRSEPNEASSAMMTLASRWNFSNLRSSAETQCPVDLADDNSIKLEPLYLRSSAESHRSVDRRNNTLWGEREIDVWSGGPSETPLLGQHAGRDHVFEGQEGEDAVG